MKLHEITEAIRTKGEFKVTTPGWYVTDHMDRAVAGPMQEKDAHAEAEELGNGHEATYFSDYDIRRSLEEGRVHTIRKPGIAPKGAPKDPARCFDTKNVDRSLLKQTKKYVATECEIDFIDWSREESEELLRVVPNTVTVRVIGGFVGGELPKEYHGVSVVFELENDKPMIDVSAEPYCVTSKGDGAAEKQVAADEKEIIAAATKGLKSGKLKGLNDFEFKLDTTELANPSNLYTPDHKDWEK